ncbi:MAG: hydroxyacid dehydrogenase [candidate division WS1 bacterium]|nr:hydroxyacid dehydrogenase [candidate division WS1 bacterium]
MSSADKTKVIFAEIKPWERDLLQRETEAAGWDAGFFAEQAEQLPAEVKAQAQVLSCFIRSQVSAELLDQMPELKLISNRSTGYDRIDVEECRRRGIVVCNVPQYGENTVAEHTFGLMLSLARHIYAAVDRAKRGDLSIEGLLGFDLYGKTLGVLGAGRIGLHVIRIGRAMNMRVLAYDAKPEPLLAEVLGFEYVELDDLLSQADVLTIHVPLLPTTKHLINNEKLALMKSSAILVNTARGAIVDSAALLSALNEDRLAGAALDVLEGEEVISEDRILLDAPDVTTESLSLVVDAYKLMHHPKVLVTGHIGFYSHEALARILHTTLENIQAFLRGEPQNTVSSRS